MKILKTLCASLLALVMATPAHAGDFTLGADISWTTELESKGGKLYNYQGEEQEAFALMKGMGLTAVRLRVWVDPVKHGGWCNKEDVLAKALRAKALGMDIMVDFHYSDWWADPAKQNIPKAWEKHKYKQMVQDVANHTTEVLTLLKQNGVDVRWVQVGNETSGGMLWSVKTDPVTGWEIKDADGNTTITKSMGHLNDHPDQYAGFIKAGCEAAKAVYPDTKTIVHLDNGWDSALYTRNLDALREGGAQWDITGMSLYPYWSRKHEPAAPKLYAECLRNMRHVVKRYGTDVMIVETGFEVDEKQPWVMELGRQQLYDLIRMCRTQTDDRCRGVFYWEPTCRPSQYKLGAFTESGHPTAIMRGFTSAALDASLAINAEAAKAVRYDRPRLRLVTNVGNIVVELYNETPIHRDNYLKLAREGSIDSTLFHRVIQNFMIQGGDPTSRHADATLASLPAEPLGEHSVTDASGEEYDLPAEIRYPQFFHKRGAVAAAREGDDKNPEYKSSGSQFYIVWGKWPTARRAGSKDEPLPYYREAGAAGVPYLDGTYTVFGEVMEGLDIVEKIQKQRTDEHNRPVDDVRIMKIEVL